MDIDRALDRFANDRPFLVEMCLDYVAGLPKRIQEIKSAVDLKNANDLSRFAHNLRGVSANFSAEGITDLCAQLEALGRHEDLATATELVSRLEVEAGRLEKYLQESGITS
jgi:HPt (histidine-containing phosphotransfer) domain-containing protein